MPADRFAGVSASGAGKSSRLVVVTGKQMIVTADVPATSSGVRFEINGMMSDPVQTTGTDMEVTFPNPGLAPLVGRGVSITLHAGGAVVYTIGFKGHVERLQ